MCRGADKDRLPTNTYTGVYFESSHFVALHLLPSQMPRNIITGVLDSGVGGAGQHFPITEATLVKELAPVACFNMHDWIPSLRETAADCQLDYTFVTETGSPDYRFSNQFWQNRSPIRNSIMAGRIS